MAMDTKPSNNGRYLIFYYLSPERIIKCERKREDRHSDSSNQILALALDSRWNMAKIPRRSVCF